MGIFFFYSFGDCLNTSENTIFFLRRKWLSLYFCDCNGKQQTAVKPDFLKKSTTDSNVPNILLRQKGWMVLLVCGWKLVMNEVMCVGIHHFRGSSTPHRAACGSPQQVWWDDGDTSENLHCPHDYSSHVIHTPCASLSRIVKTSVWLQQRMHISAVGRQVE